MENGKASSKYRSRNYARNSKSSLRSSVRKSKARKKATPIVEKRPETHEEVISPDELLKQNSVAEEELSESIDQSDTTLTQQESNNYDDQALELQEIKEERVQRRRSSMKKPKSRRVRDKVMRKSQSGKKQAVHELRKSCYGRDLRTPKSESMINVNFNLGESEKENKLYIESLKNKLNQLVSAGEYLKADMVYKEMKKAKSRFSEVVVSNIKKELSEGEKMLNETLMEEEKDLQNKFDELRQRIVEDFDSQLEDIEKKYEDDKQQHIDKFNETEEQEHEKYFKKSIKLLNMEEQIRGLIKNREYREAEVLKHKITNQMNKEVNRYRIREENKLNKLLDDIDQKKNDHLKTLDQKLQSALDELQIAFREQKESLKKRQLTLQRNFKNKEMLKLNRVNLGKDNKKTVQKFRSEVLRKEPFKNHRFRKTILNKENCIDK